MFDAIKSTYLFAIRKSYLLVLIALLMFGIDFVGKKLSLPIFSGTVVIYAKSLVYVLWLQFLLQMRFQWKKLVLLTLVFPVLVYVIKLLSLLPYIFLKLTSHYLLGGYTASVVGLLMGGIISLYLVARLSIVFAMLADSKLPQGIVKGRNKDWLIAGFVVFLPLMALDYFQISFGITTAMLMIFSAEYYRRFRPSQI